MLRRVALVNTDVSYERIASIIRVKIISDLVKTLAVTSKSATHSFITAFAKALHFSSP
jgi:hypothetical protein